MKNNLKIIMILIASLTIVTAKAQLPEQAAQSKILTDSIHSKILNANRAFNIFLPKSYEVDKDKHYPILYLLHGMTNNHQSWTERGHLKDVMDLLVASGEAVEMIIVSPNAGGKFEDGAWNGYFNMPGWSYEDFFYQEFVPYIESTYRVIGNKQNRSIAGLSMGGGGATSYGQRHSDMFNAVYAMSALMNIPEYDEAQAQNADEKMVVLVESVIENSCIEYVESADEARKDQMRSVKWFVDCGDDDFLLDRNIEFVQAMHKAEIPVEFRVRDGGHTWEYWHSALYTCLPFVSRTFEK